MGAVKKKKKKKKNISKPPSPGRYHAARNKTGLDFIAEQNRLAPKLDP